MMKRRSQRMAMVLLALAMAGVAMADSDDQHEVAVQVALLSYGDGQTAKCFSKGFLDLVARETDLPVARTFAAAALDDDDLFAFPLVVLAGEGAFTLNDAERANLKRYIDQGGLVIASAACSSAAWGASFQQVMGALFGDEAMQPIEAEHAIFHTLYEIDRVQMRRATVEPIAPLVGMAVNGTLRVVFSPAGLNDTDHAGGGCCCCGGNEIRNARLINANLLTYALTN